MDKKAGTIKRGQAISFRVPSDTPDHLLKHLQTLKETERRNFSSKIAEFVLQGVGSSYTRERETITIPLPHRLSKSQRDWLKHEHSEALLGSIIYQLLKDPVRSTALLASLNSNSLDINDALYLQEDKVEDPVEQIVEEKVLSSEKELAATMDWQEEEDDLSNFTWERSEEDVDADEQHVEKEESLDDLLGDFLARMND
ncbi:hypothetical protein [Lederbergia graminis]|uniref:Plasmid segregation centromere-binding protein ParR n=1 Tax=Lederbergia graminis TaxID=735518 RepID=A0ABW0LIT0_9BACI|nr:hypothetical protein [Paenibacillus bovis]